MSSEKNYSFQLFDFNEAITPYGTISIGSPNESSFELNNFVDGEHFRTGPEEHTNSLILKFEDRLLNIILDESGSMTWNDNLGDRYNYIKRLLTKLKHTYPGNMTTNLIGFGGIPVRTKLYVAKIDSDAIVEKSNNLNVLLQSIFEDSIFDFSGVRVVRRTDRFPIHPGDGVVVAEGIIDAVKDENLTEKQPYYYGVWTFNKNREFSAGQFVRITPTDRILPRGVNFATATPRILPGVIRDENTILILNFLEKIGYLTFDSSGNNNHGIIGRETIEESFWSGDETNGTFSSGIIKKPVGVKFDGEFDIVEVSNASDQFSFSSSGTLRDLTINFWVLRYDVSSDMWIMGVSPNDISDDIGYAIGFKTNGKLGFQINNIAGGFVEIPNSFIGVNQWTMVTITMSSSGTMKTYINSQLVNTDSTTLSNVDLSGNDTLFIGAKPVDDSTLSQNTVIDYFGALGQISIHDTIRSTEYISDLYNREIEIFNQPIAGVSQNPPDNKQREVLLSWEIGDDFNFQNGKLKIVRKYRSTPNHQDDGETVIEKSVETGKFYYLDQFDFINNSDYFYKMFTITADGFVSDTKDSTLLSAHIKRSINDDLNETVLPVTDSQITIGNKKILLQWSANAADNIRGTKIYFGYDKFPTISLDSNNNLVVTDGVELTDITDNFFIHRTTGKDSFGNDITLINGIEHFYTIVNYDRYGQFSEPVFLSGLPSVFSTEVFVSDKVRNIGYEVINPSSVSVQWELPTIHTSELKLYLGETSVLFGSVKDIYGGELVDVTDLSLLVCTKIKKRGFSTRETPLTNSNDDTIFANCAGRVAIDGCSAGVKFNKNCNTEEEAQETILNYSTISEGIIKGTLTHINDRNILSRRERYTMSIITQYSAKDPITQETVFEFNTKPIKVIFEHPIKISMVNKLKKFVTVPCDVDQVRGKPACECPQEEKETTCTSSDYNGGYVNATIPYICRVELQYKGQSLPDGTPINVQLFKNDPSIETPSLKLKSDRTFITEGSYNSTAVIIDELDSSGTPTGEKISKSIVDIPINHPSLPDYVDVYASLDFGGLFVDAVHSVRFVSNLVLQTNINVPFNDGIQTAEQFAYVHTLDPDFPDNPDLRKPVPDGTVIKWELQKHKFAKDRPFYSIISPSTQVSGVYSTTKNGVSRGVFFGPVGNVQNHIITLNCGEDGISTCCVGEEYAIKASVILNESSITDTFRFSYDCNLPKTTINRFLVNADPSQPYAGGPQAEPHWITWADGIHLLKFQIAQNPIISGVYRANCFLNCVEASDGQIFPLPDNQIVQITAPGEILWDVEFDIDEYTGQFTPVSYKSAKPDLSDKHGNMSIANINLTGDTTDFYIRLNHFIDKNNPHPQDCSEVGGAFDSSSGIQPCQWENFCGRTPDCGDNIGRKWDNVGVLTGVTTIIINNKEVALSGGGDYREGIPPVYIGFIEPLQVSVLDVRINGTRTSELVVDNVSQHTFTVEVTFAGEPVPDGTPVELSVSGENSDIILLSSCLNSNNECVKSSSGTVYCRLVNDPIINPASNETTVRQRSLAYFTIDPLPNIKFNGRIDITCKYDKLGTAKRSITSCVELKNSGNEILPTVPAEVGDPVEQSAASNELLSYDTLENIYELKRSNFIQRMGQFCNSLGSGSNDKIVVTGGYTGSSNSSTSNITGVTEIFDLSDQEWTLSADMPTARSFGSSVVFGDEIYYIGGVELNPLLSQYQVSRKLEVFDVSTGTWNSTRQDMPEDYGVAYGDAQIIDGYIYVVCGINTIINNSQPGRLNDKILRYSIADDEWIVITPSDLELYQRLTPFGFYRSQPSSDNASDKKYYIYGGSIPKSQTDIDAERTLLTNQALDEFRTSLAGSSYFQSLTLSEQEEYIDEQERAINDGIIVPAFIYPSTGFRFSPGTETLEDYEYTIDTSDTLDQYWRVLPKQRDQGKCVYIEHQDKAYFIGGSNQNTSTTLNRVESIDLSNSYQYAKLTSLNRGRAMFGAASISDDILIFGGLTSGHKAGYVSIDVEQSNKFVETRGTQSNGILISLKNDSNELVQEDVRVIVQGRVRIPEIDDVLVKFFTKTAINRIASGDSSGLGGTISGADEESSDTLTNLINGQNRVIDPSSDEFQLNAAKKLLERILLFPVLYSSNETVIHNGIGALTMLPRSEDPFEEVQKLGQFLKDQISNTSGDGGFGGLTREELASLGDSLLAVKLPPTIIDSGATRNLYIIETVVTVLDPVYFGETISDFDTSIQAGIQQGILDEIGEIQGNTSTTGLGSGSESTESPCFLVQHLGSQDIPQASTPSQNNPRNPAGLGGFSQSGQCLYCQSILPLNVDIRDQLPTTKTQFYNTVDWIPQVKRRLVDSNSTIDETLELIDLIDHEIPFGGSQLYNALSVCSEVTNADDFDSLKKSIYVLSDDSPNLSLISREEAILSINTIDGEKKVPVVYTVFSTSYPITVAAQSEKTQSIDVERLVIGTGGQSSTLISSDYLNEILNQTIGSAVGGLGFGIYTRTVDLGSVCAITAMELNFSLPVNTRGFLKFRHSEDGFNYNDFSEKFEGSQTVEFANLFARYVIIEVTLTSGFTADITEEYDDTPTGIPKLIKVIWSVSSEKEDFIFLDAEILDSSVQEVSCSVDADIPRNADIQIGVALSNSHNWNNFKSKQRPFVNETGKITILDRYTDSDIVGDETLSTTDGLLYKSFYGSWDPESQLQLFEVNNNTKTLISSGYVAYPNQGEIYFDTPQPLSRVFTLSIVNPSDMRVGIRTVNRLHSSDITLRGVGFIYSSSNIKPAVLTQVAPKAINVSVIPNNADSSTTIEAKYIYVDLNGNKESGTLISWYKNGVQLLEIENLKSWTNKDLILSHKLSPGDKVYFKITPSDGIDYGIPITSVPITILPKSPIADGLKLIPIRGGVINNRFDTSSIFKIEYTFDTEDSGATAAETGTIIQWFVNGQLFKETTFNPADVDPYIDPKTLIPGESANGILAHTIGNQIYVEVTPKTDLITGTKSRSSVITVENSTPVVISSAIQPTNPNIGSTLILSYTLEDADITAGIQSDRSEIKWYKSTNNTNFTEAIELRNEDRVPPFYLTSGEFWYATITPSDGIDIGIVKKSATVKISQS